MTTKKCPSCGGVVADGVVVCPACDFVVDASFLDEYADADGDVDAAAAKAGLAKTRPSFAAPAGAAAMPAPVGPAPDEDAGFKAGLVADTATFNIDGRMLLEPAPGKIANAVQKMLEPAAVLMRTSKPLSASTTPLELFVLKYIDGMRPVARIVKKSGIAAADLKTAISLLAERRIIQIKGFLVPDRMRALELLAGDDLDDSDDDQILPAIAVADIATDASPDEPRTVETTPISPFDVEDEPQ